MGTLLQALGLNRDPFSDDGMTGLFYPGADRWKSLDKLCRLIRAGSPFLVLLGEQGSGKSTLKNQLLNRLGGARLTPVQVDAGPFMDEPQLMEALAHGFGLEQSDSGSFVEAFSKSLGAGYSYVAGKTEAGAEACFQMPLVVIENGHSLSPPAVMLLFGLVTGRPGLSVLLLADGRSIREVPVLSQFNSLIATDGVTLLRPLYKQEVMEYLEYRMVTGGLGEMRLTTKQVGEIEDNSLGNIQAINRAASKVFSGEFSVDRFRKNRLLPLMLLTFVGVLAAYLASFGS